MITEETQSKWQLLKGDGSTQRLTPEKFTALKAEFEQIGSDAGASVNDRRQRAEDTYYCRWPGQSPDGRKHDDALGDGKKAFPFDGASDARLRIAEDIAQEQVIVIMASLMRMQLGVKGTEAKDMELAAEVNVLWRWMQQNQLGVEWFVENTKVAQNRQGDSPGVGILQVNWCEEKALKPVTITSEDVQRRAVEAAQARGVQLTPQDGAELQDLVSNVERTGELAELLRVLWPDMPESRAATVASDLLKKDEATFAYPYTCENRLKVKSRRLFDDIFCPENTTDPQRARVWFVREWYTEPELREKEARGEFKSGFVDEVLKHEGKSGWKFMCRMNPETGELSSDPQEVTWDEKKQRGLYEIITAFYRGVNEDGIPGVYTVDYHHAVEQPGTDQTLFDSPKARYPFFPNPREIARSGKLWDVRGVAEMADSEQSALKQLHDSFMDHVQLNTVPPVSVPMSRPKMALVFKPLALVREQRPGEIKAIQLGQYPQGNDKVASNIEQRLARLFGQMRAENMPDWVRLYQQNLIDSYFVHIAEVVKYGLALAWEYLPDETIERILGHPIDREPDAMEYDVQVGFEAGMLNLEFLKTVGEMISKYVLMWDTQSTVQRDRLVRWFFSALSPTLAQELLLPAATAQQNEVEDEQKNFSLISAGVEPPMLPSGQNYALRLQVQMDIGKKNPEAWDKLTPKSHEILQRRLKHLEFMVQQQQNAQEGRVGAKPALGPQSAAEAVGA